METKKLKKQGEEFKFQGGREGNLKFKDSKIQDSKFKIQNLKFKIQHTSYLIPHTSYLFQHSAFCILHSSFKIKSCQKKRESEAYFPRPWMTIKTV